MGYVIMWYQSNCKFSRFVISLIIANIVHELQSSVTLFHVFLWSPDWQSSFFKDHYRHVDRGKWDENNIVKMLKASACENMRVIYLFTHWTKKVTWPNLKSTAQECIILLGEKVIVNQNAAEHKCKRKSLMRTWYLISKTWKKYNGSCEDFRGRSFHDRHRMTTFILSVLSENTISTGEMILLIVILLTVIAVICHPMYS